MDLSRDPRNPERKQKAQVIREVLERQMIDAQLEYQDIISALEYYANRKNIWDHGYRAREVLAKWGRM